MSTDTSILWVRAESAIRSRRWSEAHGYLRQLIESVERIDFEYEEWLRATIECLKALHRHAEAAACQAYLGAVDVPNPALLAAEQKRAEGGDEDAKNRLKLTGIYLARAGHHEVAARWFAAAQMLVHQAISLERAGLDRVACELWDRLIVSESLADHPYELALVRINYGLCLDRLKSSQARRALALATSAIEQVACKYEAEGSRERSFDCYQLLARIGLETSAFENVAEGYLNSIRILRDDALKLDALRLYEAFINLARRANEHHAVASTLREAADYCIRVGLPYGEDLRMRCGDAWIAAAQALKAEGLSSQLVENAYLAAAEAFVSIRAFRQAAAVYQTLCGLEVKGAERYKRLLAHLGNDPEDAPRPTAVPEFLKRLPEYEEVWYVDLAEWELQGEPSLIAAGVMADRRFPDYIRRHALLLLLLVNQPDREANTSDMIRRLQSIRAYPVIDALEKMYYRGGNQVKRQVCAVMGSLRFKRSFNVLTEALSHDDAGVRSEAAGAIASLYFPHAFDRLRRIYEMHDLPDTELAKSAAIKAIGRINTIEALDFLCDRLREGEVPYVEYAAGAIGELTNSDLVVYIRQNIDIVPMNYRSLLEDVAQRLTQRAR